MSLRFLMPLLFSTALMAQFPGRPFQPMGPDPLQRPGNEHLYSPGMENLQKSMEAQRRQLRQAMAQYKAAKANQAQKTASGETGVDLARLPKPQSIAWRFEPGRTNLTGTGEQTSSVTSRKESKSYSTMAYPPAFDGKRIVITLDKPQRICGLDRVSGKTLWETPL